MLALKNVCERKQVYRGSVTVLGLMREARERGVCLLVNPFVLDFAQRLLLHSSCALVWMLFQVCTLVDARASYLVKICDCNVRIAPDFACIAGMLLHCIRPVNLLCLVICLLVLVVVFASVWVIALAALQTFPRIAFDESVNFWIRIPCHKSNM